MLSASEKHPDRIDPDSNEKVQIAEEETRQVGQMGNSAARPENQGKDLYCREDKYGDAGGQGNEKVNENRRIREKVA